MRRFIRGGTCTQAGHVEFRQYRNNNVVPVCYQLSGDLFCRGINSDSTAIKGLNRANLEQIVCPKKTAIVLVQRAVQVCTNQKKMEDD